MGKIRSIFMIPELRQKILLTLLFLAIYRMGYWIPLPFVDQNEMLKNVGNRGGLGNLLGFVSMFSGGNLQQATIFGWGIMPYISASIIFQLLAAVYPPLEKLQKEGESGRKKINEYTRYATVGICLIQSFGYVSAIMKPTGAGGFGWALPDYNTWFYWAGMIIVMTGGTIFLMWLGEQIDEYGIGNGISLIIMAGIVARVPAATSSMFTDNGHFNWNVVTLGGEGVSFEKLCVLAFLFVAVVVAVIAITKGQRRIPTQSAKHVRGRRVFGGTKQFLPLKVNQAGVMPVIFASSLLALPAFLFGLIAQSSDWGWMQFLADIFGGGRANRGYIYNLLFIAMIYVFCYFWTAIIFKPKDMANNLKDYGSFIPGYRPGKRTAEYLEKVMIRITYVGAAFLAVIAVIPTVISAIMGVDPTVASFFGGTGLLIVVSVALDLVSKINSHLVMRNYPPLTED